MRFGILAALILVFVAAQSGSAYAERRVALVIGNSAYQNVPKLPNPVNDARAVATLLKNAGFDVVESRSDLGIANIRRAMRDFTNIARDADIGVVYFAGHGIEVDGTNYLIPVDAVLERDTDVDDETLSVDRVMKTLEAVKRLRLVILDACRDNPFMRNMKRTIASRSVGRGLAKVEPVTSDTLIAFAAKAGSTAMDGDGKNSPFTAALIKYLAMPGLDLRIGFGRVRDDVMKATSNQQEPFVYGSLGGDVVSLVPTPEPKVVAPGSVTTDNIADARRDYEFVERAGTIDAWVEFLKLHPSGLYANLARAQLAKLQATSKSTATGETKTSGNGVDKPATQGEDKGEKVTLPSELDSSAPRVTHRPANVDIATPTADVEKRASNEGAAPSEKLAPKEIVVSWVEIQQGVRPKNTYRVKKNVRLGLYGGSSISDTFRATNSIGATQTTTVNGIIGSPIGRLALLWNVPDTNTLIRTVNQFQSSLTIRVTVGVSNVCRAQVTWDLRPGFSEYKFRTIRNPDNFIYLRSISVEGISCTSTVNQSNVSAYAR
jgi:Caspase domain